jgi:cellulose synthase/poly-beta-1,6-N-acetylglucosamine synthase-like glycosyltransferase
MARDTPREWGDRNSVDITVVVPAYNGAATIVDCLDSVLAAIDTVHGEVIVSDSSTDGTPELVRERFPTVHLLHSDQRLSAGAARNCGADAARGRLIFFVDQDCVVPIDWVERIVDHFRDGSVDGVGGAVGIRNPSSSSSCAIYFVEFFRHLPGNGRARRDNRFLIGCNSAYRARLLRKVRFPDQTIAEDILFWHELRRHGFHTVYDPRIVVLNHNREGWREFFRYNHQMGRAAASYHAALSHKWAKPFLRYPNLVFLAPGAVLPWIAMAVLRSPWAYQRRFGLVAPMCFFGNLCWAYGFRERARELSEGSGRHGTTKGRHQS